MFNGIIRIWKVRIKAKDELSIPAADSIVYNGIMFITTGIMKRPSITLIIKFFALNSNLANAYPPNALTATLKIVHAYTHYEAIDKTTNKAWIS